MSIGGIKVRQEEQVRRKISDSRNGVARAIAEIDSIKNRGFMNDDQLFYLALTAAKSSLVVMMELLNKKMEAHLKSQKWNSL